VLRHGDTVTTSVGSQDRHLLVHEEGGTFNASGPVGFFRIPTKQMQTGVGADRLMGKSARSLVTAFVWPTRAMRAKSKSGYPRDRFWVVMADRKGGLAWLYRFVKSIKLRGRHVFVRAREDVRPKLEAIAHVDVQAVVRRANGS
jgi:hypothetical protein